MPPEAVPPTDDRGDDIATAHSRLAIPVAAGNCAVLRRNGIEPVWKDWDAALMER